MEMNFLESVGVLALIALGIYLLIINMQNTENKERNISILIKNSEACQELIRKNNDLVYNQMDLEAKENEIDNLIYSADKKMTEEDFMRLGDKIDSIYQ